MYHYPYNRHNSGRNKYPRARTIKQKDNKDDDDDDKKTKIKTYTTKDKSWDMETETIEECPHMKDEQKVIIEKKAKHKIEAMMDIMGSDEWIGMLVGDNSEDEWKVKDLHIPEQKVSGARAKKTDKKEPKETIGVIHSHHSMGSFFSGTDEENVNQNYNLSLVIDSDFEFEGMARERTQCGKMARKEVEIEIEDEYDTQREWAEKVKDENISKKTYTTKRKKYNRYWKGRYNKDDDDDDDDDDENDDDEEELSYYEIWNKVEEEQGEDVDFDELYDEYEKYLKKAGYFDDEDWDFTDDEEDENEILNYDGKTIDIDELDDDDIYEIAVAAVDAPRIKACDLNFVDWLSINKPKEYEDYFNKSDDEKVELIKEYLQYAEEDEVEYINNSDVPEIEMEGVEFPEWLKENKPDIYFVWNEVETEVQDELIKKFAKYVEVRNQNTNN